jgi:Gluconate 2-dehydrogenase subunit 3
MKLRKEGQKEEPSQISNFKSQSSDGVSRREMIKLTAGAAISVPEFGIKQLPRKSRPKPYSFFSPTEFKIADELSELIIPADEHSPGARAAKVADYLDKRLAETRDEELKRRWREGLKMIDSISRELGGKSFLRATPDERIKVMERISQNEANPQTAEEKFFVELKARVAHAYYTSKIGLRQELEYKGNTYLREFVGEEVK